MKSFAWRFVVLFPCAPENSQPGIGHDIVRRTLRKCFCWVRKGSQIVPVSRWQNMTRTLARDRGKRACRRARTFGVQWLFFFPLPQWLCPWWYSEGEKTQWLPIYRPVLRLIVVGTLSFALYLVRSLILTQTLGRLLSRTAEFYLL